MPINVIPNHGTRDHGALDGLLDDDHTQYALLAGRTGGQTLIGSTLTSEDLILKANAVDTLSITLDGSSDSAIIDGASNPRLTVLEGGDTTSPFELIQFNASTSRIRKTRGSAGNAFIEIAPIPSDGAGLATIDLFAGSSTTGITRLNVLDGADALNHRLAGGTTSIFNDNNSSNDIQFKGLLDDNTLYIDTSADAVGIGTATPNQKLHVSGGNVRLDNTDATTFYQVRRINSATEITSGEWFGGIQFQGQGTTQTDTNAAKIIGVAGETWSAGSHGTGLGFHTTANGTAAGSAVKMTLSADGDLGIGTATPAEKLHVYQATGQIESLLEVGDASNSQLKLKNSANEFVLRLGTGGKFLIRNTATTIVTIDSLASKEAFNINDTRISFNQGNLDFDVEWQKLTTGTAYKFDAGLNDHTWQGDTDASLLVLDGSADAVGIGTATPNEKLTVEGVLSLDEVAAPSLTAGYGKVYVKTDTELYFLDSTGVEHNLSNASNLLAKDYSFRTAASGTAYSGGFYESSATDANLTQASTTVNFGSANNAYGAHAFIVAGGAGAASGGSGVVEIEVSGTSITDAGVRTAADTQVILADVTAGVLDTYYETTKKWIGTITFTIQNAGGGTHTTYNLDFNYGVSKYDDNNNSDYKINGFEVTGIAGANDTGFNVELIHHTGTGWTYAASGFVPGNGSIADMGSDYNTENNLVNNEQFAYKRDNLATTVTGSGSQGHMIRITTTANNAVDIMNIHVIYAAV